MVKHTMKQMLYKNIAYSVEIKAVGARIRLLRLSSSLTQAELAELCGIYRSYLSRIENGLVNPTLKVLDVIARALRVKVHDLFP